MERLLMYSKYIKQLIKDFENLPHQQMIDKYKPDEILKANKLSQQKKHIQTIDNQSGGFGGYIYSNINK